MATLQSKIRLCKGINVDRNYVNVLNYSESNMLALCESQAHLVASANDYSFIRNKGTISTAFSYDDALKSNYIAFQNKDYSNKWFFAWIDEVIYNGENNTEIRYTIDAWSTWFDYWTAKTCFVTREHVNDDTIGLNTIPEDLSIGDIICEQETSDASYGNQFTYYVAIESAWTPDDNTSEGGKQFNGISVYNNSVFGTKLFLFSITSLSDFANIALFLIRTNGDAHIADINNMFIVPSACINSADLTQHTATTGGQNFTWYTLGNSITYKTFNTTINKRTSFSDYTPKNNKCFVYPYNYLYVTNNQGASNIYKYENFSSSTCIFKNDLCLTIGGSGRLIPKDYKGIIENFDESLPLGKYPTCAWSSDAYINWLTQNAVNMTTQYTSDVVNISGSALKEDVGGTATGIASMIGGVIGSFYSADLLPNIQGGNNTGDIIWSSDNNRFIFKEMRAKTEYIKCIDDFFTRFGYKVNRVKVPNITGRTYWNYVEIGATEDIGYGDVPSNYMEEINNACRKGVTIWHNHANIGNYSLSNTIVT